MCVYVHALVSMQSWCTLLQNIFQDERQFIYPKGNIMQTLWTLLWTFPLLSSPLLGAQSMEAVWPALSVFLSVVITCHDGPELKDQSGG